MRELLELDEIAAIGIWRYQDAPLSLKSLVSSSHDWIAVVSTGTGSEEAVSLLMGQNKDTDTISWITLSDGSVVFAGFGRDEATARTEYVSPKAYDAEVTQRPSFDSLSSERSDSDE
jgi:hypothetical protein